MTLTSTPRRGLPLVLPLPARVVMGHTVIFPQAWFSRACILDFLLHFHRILLLTKSKLHSFEAAEL